jgi:hypothetical protein
MWPFKKRPRKPLAIRRARFSWRSSFLLHALVLGYVAYECLMLVALPMPDAPANQQIVLHAPPLAVPPEAAAVEIKAYEKNTEHWLAEEAVDTKFIEQAQGDPRWTQLTEGDLDQRPPDEKAASDNFLSAQVMRAISEAERHSDEDNLERLKNLSKQVTQVSTEEGVAAVSAQLNKLLGNGPRATEPAKEPVAGDFDFDTAQLHDYRREMLEDGTFKYTAVLLDSAGRTLETEMSAAEGEPAYKTFELIKQNPLLERVYRGVIMSLLDKAINPRQ